MAGYNPNDFSNLSVLNNALQGSTSFAGAGQNSGFDLGSGASYMPASSSLPGASGGMGGFGLDGLKVLTGGLQTIGNLWNAFQAQKLAKEQFAFQKDFANTNLNNSIASYNTALTDKITSRSFTQGDSADVTAKYLADNKLTR